MERVSTAWVAAGVVTQRISAAAVGGHRRLGYTVTPSPHHPIGAKGIGESATVGSPAAVVNAVLDAIGVRHADMPLTPSRVWSAMNGGVQPPQ